MVIERNMKVSTGSECHQDGQKKRVSMRSKETGVEVIGIDGCQSDQKIRYIAITID